jgi:HSP20 family protein
VRNVVGRKARKQRELALPESPPAQSPSPLGRLRSDMDRVFEGFFRDPWRMIAETRARAGMWAPDVDIIDTDREVTVRAEIPGIDPKDLEVTVSGDMLTISGRKTEEKEEKGKAFFRSERRYGAFRRSLALPAGIDAQQVSAEIDKGVLAVRIPKTREGGARRIEISPPPKTS